MINFQKLGQTLALASLSIISTFVVSTAHADQNQNLNQNTSPGFHSITFQDASPLKWTYPVLQASMGTGMWLCKSTSDPECSRANAYVYNSILKVCQTTADIDCVESLSGIGSNGTVDSGKFERYVVENHLNSFPADSTYKIPEGKSTPGIWDLASTPHAAGTKYAVVAGENGTIMRTLKVLDRTLSVSIVPVTLDQFGTQNGKFNDVYYESCRNIQQSVSYTNINCGSGYGPTCFLATAEPGLCYVQHSLPAGQKFRVTLRLSKEPTAWLHGRMTDPDIQIVKATNGIVQVSVTASPTSVPTVHQEGMWETFPQDLRQFWVDCMIAGDGCAKVGTWAQDMDYWSKSENMAGNAVANLEAAMYGFGDVALNGMKSIAPLIQDKAQGSISAWSFRTLSTNEMSGADRCFTSTPGVKGIVTTNSTAYSAGPPALKDGSLNYKVASAHYSFDGSIFRGTYNLVVRSDVARCLYNFSAAPIKASIEVVSENGDASNVATTVSAEKDGWLSLSASNFTFSAPTVKVKLTQDAPTFSGTKKVTITCTKGKVSKKVTASKPVCPKGYIKK